MPDFIAEDTLDTIATLVRELDQATTQLTAALTAIRNSGTQHSLVGAPVTVTPQEFVELVLALDEQISRTRLLLPLCTTAVQINENGRTLALSDLLVEVRSGFDSLARAQLETLIEDSPDF